MRNYFFSNPIQNKWIKKNHKIRKGYFCPMGIVLDETCFYRHVKTQVY